MIDVAGDEYGTKLDKYRGRPGDIVTLSGSTQRGEDGRYAPSDRIEAWWNTQVPRQGSPLKEGPVALLVSEEETDRCQFSAQFAVPDAPPGTYRISVIVWDDPPTEGYGLFLSHEFEVLPDGNE